VLDETFVAVDTLRVARAADLLFVPVVARNLQIPKARSERSNVEFFIAPVR
jgi:hypothetical protein